MIQSISQLTDGKRCFHNIIHIFPLRNGHSVAVFLFYNLQTKEISADSVVLCVGYASENTLYEAHKNDVDEIYLLGDARQVSNIMYGIWDAFEVANHI